MPRSGKGGARQGTPGTSYSNRTDLNLPISTVPGQEYGVASQEQLAQRAIPMAQQETPQIQTQAPQTPDQSQQAPTVRPLPRPGSMPYISPTLRPNEPVTAGLPFGPGPGPTSAPSPLTPITNQLYALGANQSASSSVNGLASIANSLGI
jgi:hypothetical protein